MSSNFRALAMWRRLAARDKPAAQEWLALHGAALYETVTLYGLYRTITAVRAYITVGDYDSAIILLKKVLKLAQAYNRPLDILETEILLSIAYWNKKLGFKKYALRHGAEAVSLAQRYGYTQMLINNGAVLFEMIQSIAASAEQNNALLHALSKEIIKRHGGTAGYAVCGGALYGQAENRDAASLRREELQGNRKG